jgi:hypothetical protein
MHKIRFKEVKKNMGWGWRGRGGGAGPWPGRGPFSYLPPWQRPGWLYGRGACWWLYGPHRAYLPPAGVLSTSVLPELKPEDEATLLTEQKTMIEEQLKAMQETLKKIQERLDELKK